MLLSQAIETQQSLYAQLQTQIEALQEQQRLIQAQLQRLGSVESKMESAAALLEEAIAEIAEVCPDELLQYKEVITSLFTFSVARLEPAVEKEEVQEPTPTPEPPTNENEDTITIDASDIKVQTIEEPTDNADSWATEDEIIEIVSTVNRLSWRDFTSFVSSVSDRKINTKGRDRKSIHREFEQYLNNRQMQTDFVKATLQGFIQSKTLKSA